MVRRNTGTEHVKTQRQTLSPAGPKAADLNEALAWGRKAAVACRAPVEVRPYLRMPPDKSKRSARSRLGPNPESSASRK